MLGHLSYQTALPSKKQELNNSVLKNTQGPQQRVNVKAGQAQIAMDGTELLGDEYYFMAHGPWRKFEAKTKFENTKRT